MGRVYELIRWYIFGKWVSVYRFWRQRRRYKARLPWIAERVATRRAMMEKN
jgi:hypothetical protein